MEDFEPKRQLEPKGVTENRARVVRGLNLEKRGSSWLRFLFRANAFPGQNTDMLDWKK